MEDRTDHGADCSTNPPRTNEPTQDFSHSSNTQGKNYGADSSNNNDAIFDTWKKLTVALGGANNGASTPSTEDLQEAWQFFVRNRNAQLPPGSNTISTELTLHDTVAQRPLQLQTGAWGSSNEPPPRPQLHHQPPGQQRQQPPPGTVEDIAARDHELSTAGKKAYSYRNAKKLQENHIKRRIIGTVKGHIFRKVKFLTCPEYYERVMKVIVEMEKPDDRARFVRIYKTCVVGAINTKRSACEQSALEAVHELLKEKNHIDEVDPAPYSMETLCKLRQSQTAEEKEAFQWFVGTLLQCVVGKTTWGRKKYQVTVSDAVHANTTEKIITVSDEAFALVMYENYIDKWIKRYHNPSQQGARAKKILGRYTGNSVRCSEYGGWSYEGMERFNELCDLVAADRSSRNAREAEEQVMLSLRRQRFGEQQPQNGEANMNADQGTIMDLERSLERNVGFVNAFIEL